jgi:hypothetical protein
MPSPVSVQLFYTPPDTSLDTPLDTPLAACCTYTMTRMYHNTMRSVSYTVRCWLKRADTYLNPASCITCQLLQVRAAPIRRLQFIDRRIRVQRSATTGP